MASNGDPVIDSWYRDTETGKDFEVIGFDEEEGSIEIQHLDGTLEDLDLDTWHTLSLQPIEAPTVWDEDSSDQESFDYRGVFQETGGFDVTRHP